MFLLFKYLENLEIKVLGPPEVNLDRDTIIEFTLAYP